MPAASDIVQFFHGQVFQTPTLPNTSFKGKTVVITGANTGLGFECAKQLIALDVGVLVLACRNISKGEEARHLLNKSTKTTIHVWQVDMASYSSVKAFNEKMATNLPRLDALILNAGISTNEFNSAEGLEETLTVNVVSAFLLALLALPQLKQTSMQSGVATHLSILGSSVHAFADHSQLRNGDRGTLAELSDSAQAQMASRYFLSKLMVILCVREMADHVSREEVIINCPNPGWCKTELFRQDDGGFWGRNLLKLIGRTGDVGARTLTSAIAAGPETHGCFLSECQVKRPSAFVRSDQGRSTQHELWTELLELLSTVSPGIAKALMSG